MTIYTYECCGKLVLASTKAGKVFFTAWDDYVSAVGKATATQGFEAEDDAFIHFMENNGNSLYRITKWED